MGPPISDARLADAVNVILSYQNSDGGWPTYELQRSFAAVELLNPAETFGDIMVDYSYVECASACMTAMHKFRARFPGHRAKEITTAMDRGAVWVLKAQRPDGSWCALLPRYPLASALCRSASSGAPINEGSVSTCGILSETQISAPDSIICRQSFPLLALLDSGFHVPSHVGSEGAAIPSCQ